MNYYRYNIKNNEIMLNDTLKLERNINYKEENEEDNYKKLKNKLKHKSKSSKFNKGNLLKNKKSNQKKFKNKRVSFNDIEIHNNLDASPTYKMQDSNKSNEKSSKISKDSSSKKANKSDISSLSKKAEKEKNDSENKSNKTNFDINIKKNINIFNDTEIEYVLDKGNNNMKSSKNNNNINIIKTIKSDKKRFKNNKSENKKNFLNQMLRIELPNSNLLTTCSNMKDNKNDYNSVEKIKNIENLSIYNIFQKNINKNLNIIDNNEKANQGNNGKSFCCII